MKRRDKLMGEMKADSYSCFLNEYYPNIVVDVAGGGLKWKQPYFVLR